MPVIIMPKNKGTTLFPTKKSAIDYLIAMGKNPKIYDIKYVYDTVARRNYPPSYKELHRKAARNWYLRNKEQINAQRRAEYQIGGKAKDDGEEI